LHLYYGENKLYVNEMMSSFVLDQQAEFDFYSASSLKHEVPLGHIISIPSNQVFAPTQCCVLSGEAANTNL